MKRYLIVGAWLSLAAGGIYSEAREQKRLENCGVVHQEILKIPDTLPLQGLSKSECVIVFSFDPESGFWHGQRLRPRRHGLPHRQGRQRPVGVLPQ
jgi:hypothetical protein